MNVNFGGFQIHQCLLKATFPIRICLIQILPFWRTFLNISELLIGWWSWATNQEPWKIQKSPPKGQKLDWIDFYRKRRLYYLLRSRICGFISRSTSSGHDFIQTSFTSKSFLFVLFQFFIQFSLFTFGLFLGFSLGLFTFGLFVLLNFLREKYKYYMYYII